MGTCVNTCASVIVRAQSYAHILMVGVSAKETGLERTVTNTVHLATATTRVIHVLLITRRVSVPMTYTRVTQSWAACVQMEKVSVVSRFLTPASGCPPTQTLTRRLTSTRPPSACRSSSWPGSPSSSSSSTTGGG